MAVARLEYYKIGGLVIPSAYFPDGCAGVQHPQSNGETNLLGEMTGARGGATCELIWEVCPATVFKWWFSDSGLIPRDQLSAPVSEVILPDDTGYGDAVQNLPYHARYDYAIVHRIEKVEQPRRIWGSTRGTDQPYLLGVVRVLITMIGEVPPV